MPSPQHALHPGPPGVPPALSRRLGLLVGAQHGRPRVACGHPRLEPGQLRLGALGGLHALGDVPLQGQVGAERRALVVQGHPGAARRRPGPASGASRPARTRQRGLALAVAPDDRQAVAGVHAEAHAVEHVAEGHAHLDRLHRRLGQRGCQRKPCTTARGRRRRGRGAGEGIAALDLEFMWERTYALVACLAQVATPRGVHLIDPIEGAPLLPVAELVADPAVEVAARPRPT